MELFYEVKSNLKKRDVRLLHDAGVLRIQPGIESFSTPVLQLMRKGVTGIQNVQLLKWCQEIGVEPNYFLLYGFPEESPEEYAYINELLPSLSHFRPPFFCVQIRLDRFSPNYVQAESLGFADVKPFPSYSYVYKLEPGEIDNLAYFFTYRYADDRDVSKYVNPVIEGVRLWQDCHSSSALFFVDKGESLLLFDLRPISSTPVYLLDGIFRSLYLACDQATSLGDLHQLAAIDEPAITCSEVSGLLERMTSTRLMMQEGSRYLSLAIPLGGYQPPPAACLKLEKLFDSQPLATRFM